jgi:dTDP-4-amino-4,6-dideoxygalactose transaminase
VTTWASDRVVRLPFFYDLTENQQQEVIDAVMTAPVG